MSGNKIFQEGDAFGYPKYHKLGHVNLFMVHTNESDYPTPWNAWGWPDFRAPHIGNLKLGPKGIECPENATVDFQNKV